MYMCNISFCEKMYEDGTVVVIFPEPAAHGLVACTSHILYQAS